MNVMFCLHIRYCEAVCGTCLLRSVCRMPVLYYWHTLSLLLQMHGGTACRSQLPCALVTESMRSGRLSSSLVVINGELRSPHPCTAMLIP